MLTNPFNGRKLKFLLPPFTLYLDNENDWRWKIKGRNGEIIGASSEGFSSKQACLNNFKLLAEQIIQFYEYEQKKP